MHTVKKKVIGAALTASIALTGCTNPFEGGKPEWFEGDPVTSSAQEIPQTPVIKVGKFASKQLSPKTAAKIDTVVRVNGNSSTPEGVASSYASGVATKLGYLSSGHVLRDENNKPFADSCGKLKVELPAKGDNPAPMRSAVKTASVHTTPEISSTDYPWRDISLIKTENPPQGDVAKLDKKNKDMAAGTEVTFVNFQPAKALPEDRSYTKSGLIQRSPDSAAPYDEPAVFTGSVLHDPAGDDKQIAVLLGHGKSFGALPDTVAKRGASGGAIMKDGITKAVTTAIRVHTQPIAEIEQEFNVDIQGERASTAQVTFIQPVNLEMLTTLSQNTEKFVSTPC